MRVKVFGLAVMTALALTACGGGGGGSSDAPATAQQAQRDTLKGVFGSLTGSVLPDPAKETDPITVTVKSSFLGKVTPAVGAFTVPIVIRKVGTSETFTGNMNFTLTMGENGDGKYEGTGVITLPAMKAGVYTFGVRLDPASKWDLDGIAPKEEVGEVTVTK